MLLAHLPVGAAGVVTSLHGRRDQLLRWAELGLRAGARVHVRSRTAGGGRLLGLGPARLAVDVTVLHAVVVDAEPS